jgi:hypothetical protein
MNKKDLLIIILAIIIGLGFGYFIFRTSPKEIVVEKVIENTQKIDSLNAIIRVNEDIIESLKDSVHERIIYIEKRVEEIKELPIDENLNLFRDNLLVYGDNFNPLDSLPSLCQISDSQDTLVLMSEGNLIDVNTIVARYEGALSINDYYVETIKADSSIISLKNSIILEKDNQLIRERENFESNMKDLETIIKRERRKQVYYTIGGMVAVGTITYLILRE